MGRGEERGGGVKPTLKGCPGTCLNTIGPVLGPAVHEAGFIAAHWS